MKTGYSFGSLVSFVEALNAAAVKITGDQTIGGLKTFSSNPITSAAQGSGGGYLTRKDYVDGALALKAPLASPALTGVPTAPTAAAGTSTTQIATTAFVTSANTAQLASATPMMDGTAAVGTSTLLARQDHKHPTDISRAPLDSPALTGIPTAPTAAADTNTTQIATTEFVTASNTAQLGAATPLMDGTATVGTSTLLSRQDHKHPTDTTRAPLASPAFTGTPTAPTQTAGNNSTRLATTAFVQEAKETARATTYTVANEAAMLALTAAKKGDLAIRSDLNNRTFILGTEPYSTLLNWKVLAENVFISDFAKTLLDDADAAAMHNTLGIADLEPRISDNESKVFEALRRSYADAGLNLVKGSFEEGGTLTNTNDVLLLANTGIAYSYSGALPKVIVPGTDPTAVGSGYVPRADVVLRSQLASDSGTDLVSGKGPASGEVSRAQSDRNQDQKTIRDFGGRDDWNGATGTNNLVPLSMYTQFCLDNSVKIMRFPFRGTGVYHVSGTDGWIADIPGIELEIDEGVSFVVDAGLRIFSRGVKCNRELVVRINNATVDFNSPLSPVQFKKPSELFPGVGQGDGVCEVPSVVDMTNVTGYNITGSLRTEIAITKTASSITVPHSIVTDKLCFAVPSKVGEEVFCYTSANGVGVIGVMTVNKVVTVECDSGTGSMLVNNNGSVLGIFAADPTDKTRNRFNSGLMSVVVTGTSTFSVLINGVHIYTCDAKDPITSVIFGNRGNTGNVVYNGISKIKGCKSIGSRPLRIIVLGDSTSQPDIAQGSQADYMRQFLASAGCQIQYMKNLAVGGETSAQQLTRFNAEDINGYDFCIAALGVNDVQTGTPYTTFASNMGAIADKCIANNVQLIASMPTSWYPQSEAAPYGQRGQNTVNSDLTAKYRAALILKMAEKGCLISTQSIKHEGVVGAVWLDTDGADPVMMDNIHPTAYGRMMMGLGNAKSILGAINRGFDKSSSGPSVIPARWKTAFTTASSSLPSVSVSDGSIEFLGGINIPSVPANGTAIIKIDKQLAPVNSYLYFTTPCQNGSGPIGSCTVVAGPDGNITVYNVPPSTTNIVLQGVEIKRY